MPIGAPELIVVLVIALLVLGPKRLPDAGKSLGRGMREFKDSLSGDRRDETSDLGAAAAAPAVLADQERATSRS
ncbi:MAG: sec-independent protein translocase protein TatA [Baekduia sp.]|nr:sec-independent protein translocase protein TatA [Baekduia sp.]